MTVGRELTPGVERFKISYSFIDTSDRLGESDASHA
jgi:hypothetical protein